MRYEAAIRQHWHTESRHSAWGMMISLCRAPSTVPMPRRTQLIEADASLAVVKLIVKIHRCIDQCQVSERLGEVTLLATSGSDLLGKEAEVISIGCHLLEGETRFLKPTRARASASTYQ